MEWGSRLYASYGVETSLVTALQDLYRALNSPPLLQGWNGGDPCQDSWTGVTCSGSSVIRLKIQGLNLTGYLGGLLHNLQNLKQLDVSSNNVVGEIPSGSPPPQCHTYKYGLQLFEPKYLPYVINHEKIKTSEFKPQFLIWTHWQCVYWLR